MNDELQKNSDIERIKTEAKAKLQEVIDQQNPKPKTLPLKTPELISCSAFDKINIPQQQWFIKDLIPQEGLAVIASPSGEKKTWLALHMAYSIATGKNFMGSHLFPCIKGNVMYLDMEMPRAELQRRIRRLGLAEFGNILIPRHIDCTINFTQDEYVEWFFDEIERHNIQVVFIDTFRATAGGIKEERAEEIRLLFDRFKKVKDMGVCIVFLDHCRKPMHHEGKTPKKEQLFASQDKVASVESLIMIKSDERSEAINVFQRKNRSAMECKPFKVMMTDKIAEDGTEMIEMTYGGEIDEKEYKFEEAKDHISDVLIDGAKRRQEIITILKAKGIGEKNASDALRDLQKLKILEVSKVGRENLYALKSPSNGVAPTNDELNFDDP